MIAAVLEYKFKLYKDRIICCKTWEMKIIISTIDFVFLNLALQLNDEYFSNFFGSLFVSFYTDMKSKREVWDSTVQFWNCLKNVTYYLS